jgi:hypothetical protein
MNLAVEMTFGGQPCWATPTGPETCILNFIEANDESQRENICETLLAMYNWTS